MSQKMQAKSTGNTVHLILSTTSRARTSVNYSLLSRVEQSKVTLISRITQSAEPSTVKDFTIRGSGSNSQKHMLKTEKLSTRLAVKALPISTPERMRLPGPATSALLPSD